VMRIDRIGGYRVGGSMRSTSSIPRGVAPQNGDQVVGG
jgi:hypothetical protein